MSLRNVQAQETLSDAMVLDDSRMLDAYDEAELRPEQQQPQDQHHHHHHGMSGGLEDPVLGGSSATLGLSGEEISTDPTRLFSILEKVMPRYEDANPTEVTGTELQQKRELAEHTWDSIRKWLRAHPQTEERQAAAYIRGAANATPLHLMCKLHHPPLDVIGTIVDAAPDIVSWPDSHGWLPLHHACANGANPDVMKVLIEAYPQGKVAQDNQKRTPLHFYATRSSDNPEHMTQNALMLTDTGAAELTDKGGMLPLHYAAAYGTDTVVLEVLADAYPESFTARENKGRTPMHLAMVNAHHDSTPHVVEFLLQHAEAKPTTNARDSDGYSPLHLLALALRGYRSDNPNKRKNVAKSLELYLNSEPYAAADFLNALQALPDWLQDTAVVSAHVRNVLNDKIVRRLPTAILMLDGYMLVVIIVCFGMATANHIDIRYADGDEEVPNDTEVQLFFLFVGASYFLLREVIQIASLVSLGSFTSWFWDFTNWLDVGVIFLVYYYALIMSNEDWGLSKDAFRSGAAFTQGVLYVDVIVYLKSTYVDFAVFVNGVYYVVQRLLAFLIAVGVILLAFAQMFFFIYKNTGLCDPGLVEGDPDYDEELDCRFPHCTFEESLLKVYTMMMGEIGDEARYSVGPTSLTAQILYVAYAFLVVILLSNVLIAIVTDSYEIIQNDRAAIVFWSNRLDFVAEMDAIIFGAQRKLCCGSNNNNNNQYAPGAPTHVKETASGHDFIVSRESATQHEVSGVGTGSHHHHHHHQNNTGLMRYGWGQVMQLFDDTLYDDMDVLESWVYNFFRIISILFVIPFWILAGVVSVGLLWPPQVREALFVQKEANISRAEVERQKLEKLIEIENDMKALKQEMMREMENDRDEMMRMRTEVEAVQTEVLQDLQQVKELLSSLLGE